MENVLRDATLVGVEVFDCAIDCDYHAHSPSGGYNCYSKYCEQLPNDYITDGRGRDHDVQDISVMSR